MGSMNWLGFSLSPQELPQSSNPHHHHSQSRLAYNNSDEISGNEVVSGECYDLSSDHHSSAAQIPPFGILEAFSRNHSQDWNNMKDLGMNSSSPETNDNYKTATSSDLSMLMSNVNQQNQTLDSNNNSSQNHHHHHQQQPKLENFLGRHSFSDHQQYNTTTTVASEYGYPAIQIPSDVTGENRISSNNNNNGSSIGLSMIKTWLRNQPDSSRSDAAVAAPAVSSSTTTTTAAQSALSLSMSTGSQSLLTADSSSSDNNKNHATAPATSTAVVPVDGTVVEAAPRKSIDTFGQRTSIYRGVTRHRWTGRYEAHLWDNSCRREGQTRKGRQVYLGGYDKEEKAARAYDLAALKYWGTTTTTNFPINNYEKEVEEMKHMTRQEYVASLRRKSSGFSRGASIYRGVTRHHQHGRWQARIGRVAGNKDLYLGTFSTQEEAAEAYDIAAIKFRGLNAVTNFDMNRYDVKSILESSTLPIGGAAKRLKDAEAAAAIATDETTTAISGAAASWPTIAFAQPAPPPLMHYSPFTAAGGGARVWCKQEVMEPENQNHHHHQQQQQGFQYHDLQMNNNTHNFFQQNSVLHNLMGIDHNTHHQDSSGSNSVMYSGGSDSGGGGGSYVIADHQQGSCAGATFDQSSSHHHHNSNSSNNNQDQHVYGASAADMAYHRSLYNYMTQQQNLGLLKPSSNGGGSYDNWVPTAVPTIAAAAPRSNHGMAVCHGTPTFTVWNDA